LKTTLITGGARSGKSRYAQEQALKAGGSVLFVATAEAGDEDMRQRIERHKKSRPAAWKTLEAQTGIGQQIARNLGGARTVVIDCITLLVNNIFQEHGAVSDEAIDADLLEKAVTEEIEELIKGIDGLDGLDACCIIVTNEVGLGLVPANRLGRLYRDLLGRANHLLAERADEVIMMVAGLPVKIKPA
jgi:adenosylcobinamide kinase/adenosylcobinamide-phosphate guanylyltransferase